MYVNSACLKLKFHSAVMKKISARARFVSYVIRYLIFRYHTLSVCILSNHMLFLAQVTPKLTINSNTRRRRKPTASLWEAFPSRLQQIECFTRSSNTPTQSPSPHQIESVNIMPPSNRVESRSQEEIEKFSLQPAIHLRKATRSTFKWT